MARRFTKNTSNKVSLGVGTLGPLFNGARTLAFHAWVKWETFNNGPFDNRLFGCVFGGNITGFTAFVDGTTSSQKQFGVGGRSQSTDGFQSCLRKHPIIAGVWYSVAGLIDFERSQAIAYVAGVRNTNYTACTFGSATFVDNATSRTSADAIGCNDISNITTATQTDANVAELTIWKNARLGQLDFTRLAAGWPSYLIRPGNIANRWTLSDAGIIDVVGGKTGTISGTVNLTPYEPFRYSAIRPYVPFFDVQAAVATNSSFFPFMSAG